MSFEMYLPGPTPNPYKKEVLPHVNDQNDESTTLLSDTDDSKDQIYDTEKKTAFFLDISRKENICLMLSYFTVGFALYFTATPVYYYLVTVQNASATEIGVFSTLIGLPWSFKIFYGLLSDAVPILGYRRKPYFLIGWIVFIACNVILAALGSPSILATILGNFVMTCGLLLSDVMTDTMCVERAKLETDITRGTLQTNGYTFRALGMVVGAVLGAIVYNQSSWGWGLTIQQIYLLNGLFPVLSVGPAFYTLVELGSANYSTLNFQLQLEDIWQTLQLRAVWQPMAFVYTYNVLQIPNSAWSNYLVEGLDFTDFELGLLTISGALMLWLGLLAYKNFFFQTGWQSIYIMTTFLGLVFSLLQLLLIYQINVRWGIPDIAFALGDTTIAAFVGAIQYMPTCIMYVVLCPDGSEGTTYALLTTISNLAGTVASDFGSWMTEIWNVSNSALKAGNDSGLVKLTILTSCLQFAPIFLVFLLPNSKEQQKKMREAGESNWFGGFTLAMTVVVSLLFTVILNIVLLSD